LGARAEAQSPILRGVVLDSASREPVSGAVITVLDATGQASNHTIASADGTFRIATSATSARLRARRIGFRPREIPIPRAGDSAAIEITMGRIPQVLASVRVVESSHCPGSADNGAAAQLWAQARDGLLAAIIARDAKPATVELLTYDRSYTPREERLASHRHRIRSGRATRAFQATGSAASFAERGYVQEDATGRTFNAPDADVLLDDSFSATHCFQLVVGTGERTNQVGLAFEPARRRRGIVDVEGTLWMDRAKPALRSVEFRYTELDRLSTAARAGGSVEFATMENGVVIISAWSLRMPVLATRRSSSQPGTFTGGRISSDVSVAEIDEGGGMVIAATWPDGTRWTQPVGALSGTVVERGTRRPIAHALVTFAGAWDTVRADSAGRFVLPTVLADRYDVVALDTTFTPHVDARSVRRMMDVGQRMTSGAVFELPASEDAIRRLCSGLRPERSILLGRVRGLPRGRAEGLDVRVDWQDEYVVGGSTVGVREAQRTIDPDSAGNFHVCGVVRERPISISVRRNGVTVVDTAVTVYDSLVHRVDVSLASPSNRVIPQQPSATLTGTVVRDTDSSAVTGAHIAIPQLRREAVTDAGGVFRMDGLSPGRYGVDIRVVGFAPRTDSVTLTAGQIMTSRFVMVRLAQLDTVTVAESRLPVSPALRGFAERRRLGGGGRFVDEAELRKHDARTLGSVIVMRIPGLRAVSTPRGVFLASLRSNTGPTGRAFEAAAPGTCWVTVYRDGSLIYDGTMVGATPPDFNRLNAQDFAAVEFYQVAATPPEFRGTSTGCGTLLLWSRERV
jgi:hypothetical protein